MPTSILLRADEVIELGLHQMLHLLTSGCDTTRKSLRERITSAYWCAADPGLHSGVSDGAGPAECTTYHVVRYGEHSIRNKGHPAVKAYMGYRAALIFDRFNARKAATDVRNAIKANTFHARVPGSVRVLEAAAGARGAAGFASADRSGRPEAAFVLTGSVVSRLRSFAPGSTSAIF